MKKINDWYICDEELLGLDPRRQSLTHVDDISYRIDWLSKQLMATDLRDLFTFIRKNSRAKDVYVDVGANYGFTSVPLANVFKEIHSFEILPSVVECLQENTKEFPNIKIYPFGLGREESNKTIAHYPKYSLISQIINSDGSLPLDQSRRGYKYIKTDVKIKPLDSLNLPKIDVIKIDVEGYEFEVIAGAAETLSRSQALIIVENVDDDKNKTSIKKALNSLGYEFVCMISKNDCVFKPKPDR
jgi:FkbM family methyltransferase